MSGAAAVEAPARTLRIAFVINQLGMMDVVAIPTVAAIALERGHDVKFFVYGRNPQKARREIAEFAPDMVAYSLCSNEERDYLTINRTLKAQQSFFAIFGGSHPTYHPRLIHEDGVDAMCRGEGYAAWPSFLDAFGTDAMYEIDNLSFRMADGSVRENPVADLVESFDDLPFPARHLVYERSIYLRHNPAKPFIAGRGCPYSCAYCYNSAYKRLYEGKGRIVRSKSVSYLLEEVKGVADKYPLKFVRFSDDTFGTEPGWLREFADRFPKEIGLPFACYVRPNVVTEEYADTLKRAGCHSVNMAVECANEHIRKEVLNRNVTNEQMRTAFARLKERGIRIMALNMIGLPGETEEDAWDTIHFNQELGSDHAHVCVFQPYPGTQAYDYCIEHGHLDPDYNQFDDLYTGLSPLNLSPEVKQRLFVLHKLFPIIVDHPRIEGLSRRLLGIRPLNPLLEFFTRFYFGYFAYRRVYYRARIPLWVRLHGGLSVLFSKNRI